MSRYDSDQDYSDWLGGPYGECLDCQKWCDSDLCEECADQRDAHTDILELRSMVKAFLRADLTKIKDVA